MINRKYPTTDFHELNLDWILSEIEKLKKTDSSESEDIKELEKLIKQIEEKNRKQDEELQEHEEDIQDLKDEMEEIKIPLMLKKSYVVPVRAQEANILYKKYERSNL